MVQSKSAEVASLERRFRELFGGPPALLDPELLRRVVERVPAEGPEDAD